MTPRTPGMTVEQLRALRKGDRVIRVDDHEHLHGVVSDHNDRSVWIEWETGTTGIVALLRDNPRLMRDPGG